jgi:L-glyceraldehyde 3-phosphate reductase
MIFGSFDLGITHFDLANNYGPPYGSAEVNVGKILKHLPRDEILITSKAGYDMWPGPYGEWGSRKYILASLDQSLKRMGVEYFDLFYSHRFDPNTPLDETLGALDTAVKQGKALYTGISSYLPESTAESVQVSMLNRWIEKSLIDVCETNGLGMIAFCPLFQGLLTDKYLGGIPEGSRASLEKSPLRKNEVSEQNIRVIQELNDHASNRGQSLAQMALSWVLRDHRITSALVGASSLAQIKDNVKSVEQKTFSSDELEKLDQILAKINLPKSLWANE